MASETAKVLPVSAHADNWSRVTLWRWLKYMLAVAILAAAWVGFQTGVPIKGYPEFGDRALAIFRILFGCLLLLRLIRSRDALALLWGWRRVGQLHRLWVLWLINTLALILGLFTSLCVLINGALFLLVFLRSRYFSIEEIYCQITALVLIFLPLGQVWSLDNSLGLAPLWHWQAADVVVTLNAYAWLLALLLMSAAYEKISVGNWRKGLSFYYFIGLPHLLKRRFYFLRRQRWLCVLASYMTVIGQGGLAFAYFVPGLRELFLLKQIGFGVLLFTVVDISFIGQFFALQFILLLFFSNADSATTFVPGSLWLSLFFTAVMVVSVVSVFELKIPAYNLCKRIAAYTSGLGPIRVFGDMHLFGLYLYRLEARGRSGELVLLPAFTDKGEPGPLQSWHPRYYQGAMYPVTDACLARRYFPQRPDHRRERLHDLIYAALMSSAARRNGVEQVTLLVKAINPDDHYVADTRHWVDSQWTPLYRGGLNPQGAVEGQWLAPPPAVKKITRQIV